MKKSIILVLLVCAFLMTACHHKSSALTVCDNCNTDISKDEKSCPNCGAPVLSDAESDKDESSNVNSEANKTPSLTFVPETVVNDAYLKLNQQNQVQNDGTFLIKDGWIYGQSWDENGKSQFIKVRTDNTGLTVLDSGFAKQINIVGNYIYYMKSGNEYGIYRINKNGNDKTLLVKTTGSVQIVDNYIFYTDNNKNNSITDDDSYCHFYRCDLDGKNVTKIINKATYYPFVFDDAILYQDDADGTSLHLGSLDGKNDVKLNNAESFWPIYDGTYIYFLRDDKISENDKRTIWKIKPDGTGEQQVAPYTVSTGIFLTDKYIYFVNFEDNDRLYRIKKDGSDLTLITQDANIRYVELLDEKIKYTVCDSEYKYILGNYFCEYDGSNKTKFEP